MDYLVIVSDLSSNLTLYIYLICFQVLLAILHHYYFTRLIGLLNLASIIIFIVHMQPQEISIHFTELNGIVPMSLSCIRC